MRQHFSDFIDDLRSTHGTNLRSVTLYGSAAAGDFVPNRSDYNILIALDKIGPRDLRIDELVMRTRTSADDEPVREVILATNPNYEGDYTAAYIAPLISRPDLKVTRLARGLPIGGDLEYADEGTLSRALEGRREV